jgi:hypothetical protein
MANEAEIAGGTALVFAALGEGIAAASSAVLVFSTIPAGEAAAYGASALIFAQIGDVYISGAWAATSDWAGALRADKDISGSWAATSTWTGELSAAADLSGSWAASLTMQPAILLANQEQPWGAALRASLREPCGEGRTRPAQLSGAACRFLVRRPDGTVTAVPAHIPNPDNGVAYAIIDRELLDQSGIWAWQVEISTSSSLRYSTIEEFTVYDKLTETS